MIGQTQCWHPWKSDLFVTLMCVKGTKKFDQLWRMWSSYVLWRRIICRCGCRPCLVFQTTYSVQRTDCPSSTAARMITRRWGDWKRVRKWSIPRGIWVPRWNASTPTHRGVTADNVCVYCELLDLWKIVVWQLHLPCDFVSPYKRPLGLCAEVLDRLLQPLTKFMLCSKSRCLLSLMQVDEVMSHTLWDKLLGNDRRHALSDGLERRNLLALLQRICRATIERQTAVWFPCVLQVCQLYTLTWLVW